MWGGWEIKLNNSCCSIWAIWYGTLLCNDLYGHYYVLNYIRYYQKIANKEHECEYITQLGRQTIINKIIYTDYFLQYYLVKDC